ncbi:protein-glutamate O-methyltransferase CheR [Pseudoalteromonas sp. MMG010]|uniref:CheR family methyltransferase n=1 Tax=Pseudoalteromonas sp. MMG010 TaxID=2822685 RepID=UPI001B39E66A|nr:protein-glutamate O-methyltransferase CheR [Pseudoalteromonas sp. MMG010]MBQ4834326.1 protein-glutamate O-methyltransferase CheR [Pseudoalteromonas sp. MMG010]
MTPFKLTESDYREIVNIVYQTSGIVLNDTKHEMVYARLVRRIRQLKLTSFSAYLDYLACHSELELDILISAITTNLTSFFREPHHFQFIKQYCVPSILSRNKQSKRVRFWSAGCATGEEAYSLAIAIQGMFPADWDVKILATDIDAQVIEQAKQGVYSKISLLNVSIEQREKWFYKNKQTASYSLHPSIVNKVTFKRLNLLSQWPMQGPFDLILCRNVMIYFDKLTKEQLLYRYNDILHPHGYLFLGHSEMIAQKNSSFISLGHTMYQKV